MNKKVEFWDKFPKGWESIPFEWREKIENAYDDNGWKKGESFKMGERLFKIYPKLREIKGLKGTSYRWEDFEGKKESWSSPTTSSKKEKTNGNS